jgi:tetratricopeptide (TPR) repeat protein
MNLSLERMRSLPDEEAWPLYRALVAAGLATPDAHLHGFLVAERLGHLHSAHLAIQEGLACDPEGDLKGRMRFECGTVLRELGYIDQAIEQFTQWLGDLNDEYPSLAHSHLGAAYYNRGLALRQGGRYTESLSDYERACHEFRMSDKPDWLCMGLHNLAWAATLAGQHKTAAAALEEAQSRCSTPELAWHQKLGEAFLAATAPEGDLHRVMSLCREILDCPDADVPRVVRSHAYWLSARVAMALDLREAAEGLVEQALIWGALAGDENRCLADATDLWHELRDQIERQ